MGDHRRLRGPVLLACVLLAAALTACSRPAATGPARPGWDGEVVVASFNFPESTLLAEIYAGAIEHAGIPVRRELDLGPRELVQPALLEGLVDVVPEYLGTALASLDPSAVAAGGDAGTAYRALASVLGRRGVEVLDPAAAQNQNGLAVAGRTAGAYGLSTISDLAAVAPKLVLGGPPECPQRPYCLQGLERVYGLHFRQFLPFDTEAERAGALADQVVDVAVMFTTDGRLAVGDLVLLGDDRSLQPSENVTPVVSSRATDRYGARLRDAVNAVSARLSTNTLRFLNWRVGIAGRDVGSEARGWLARQGLGGTPG